MVLFFDVNSINVIITKIGNSLISAGDGGIILIWTRQQETSFAESNILDDDEEDACESNDYKQSWSVAKMFRTSDTQDIYDIDCSPCGRFVIVGLTDNSAQVWDVWNGKQVKVLKDHKHFVQGVAWDPLGQYIATQSCDRTVKIWNCVLKRSSASKVNLKFSPHGKFSKSGSLFQDESCVSFFRRLKFSPDGGLLVMPVGLAPDGTCAVHVAYRSELNHATPRYTIGGFEKPVIAIRFANHFYEKCSEDTRMVDRPYRMLLAVLTQDMVFVFDTEHKEPLWCVSGLHYGTLTDVAWSPSGDSLIVTSTDGFCSLLTFEHGDLMSGKVEDRESVMSMARLDAGLSSALNSNQHENNIENTSVPSSEPDPVQKPIAVNQLIPKKRSLLSME